MRDRSISTAAKAKYCCLDENSAKEDKIALGIITDAMKRYGIQSASKSAGRVNIITVSYEAMMELKETYLLEIYHQLGVNSTYVPAFEDANAKYVTGLQKEDLTTKTTRKRHSIRKKLLAHHPIK
jgi:hypothetical protein